MILYQIARKQLCTLRGHQRSVEIPAVTSWAIHSVEGRDPARVQLASAQSREYLRRANPPDHHCHQVFASLASFPIVVILVRLAVPITQAAC